MNGRHPQETAPGELDPAKYLGDKILLTSRMSATYQIQKNKRAYSLKYPRGTPATENDDIQTQRMTWDGSVQMRLSSNSDLVDGFIDPASSNHVFQNYVFRHLDYPVSKFSYRERGHFYLPDSYDVEKAVVLKDTVEIDGRPCRVVSIKGRDKMWVDVGRGFALVKREIRDENENVLLQRTFNSDWVKVGPGMWLPQTSVREYYCGLDRPKDLWNTVSTRVTLHSKFSNEKIPAEAFTIEFPPGTYVTDVARGDTYRIPQAGVNPLDSAVAQALAQNELPSSFPARKSSNWWSWVLIVNLNVLLLIGLMIGIRKWRKLSGDRSE